MLFLFVTFCSSLQKVCIGNLNCPSDYTPDFDLTTVTSPDDYNIFICDLPYDIYLNASCFIANTMLNIYSDTGHANFVYFYVYSSIELTSFSIKNSHFYFVNEDYTKEYTITIHEDTSIEKSELGVHGYFEFDFNSLYFDFCSKPKSTVGYQLGYFNSLKILCDSDDLGLCSTFYTHFMLVAKTDDDSFDSELNILYTDDNQINTELGTNNDYREIRFSMYNNYQFNILINEEVNYNIIFNPHTPDDKALIRYDNLLKRYPNIKALFNLTSGSELSIDDIYSTISPHGYYKLNFIYYLEQIKEIIVPSEGLDLYLYAGISYYISYYFDKFIFEENSVLNLSTHFNSMDSFSIYINNTFLAPGASIIYEGSDLIYIFSSTNYKYSPSDNNFQILGNNIYWDGYSGESYPLYPVTMDVYLNYSLPTMYVNVKLDHTLEKIKPIHSQQKLNNLYIYLSPQSYEYSIETASTYKNFIDGTEINMFLNKFTPIVCMEKTLYSDNNILYHYNLTDFANVNSYYDDFSISYDENSECYGIILNNKLKESFQHYCLYEKDNSNCPSYSTPVTPDTFNTVTVQSNAPTKIYIIENITQKTDLKYSMNNPLYIVGINSNGNYPLVTLGDLSSSSNITISEITLHGYLSIKANSVWLRRLTGTAIISAEVEDDVFTNEIDMISVYTQSSDIVLSSSKISFVYDSMGLHISDDSIEYHYSDPCESYIIMILQDEVDLAITIDDDFDLYPAISLHFDQYFSTINILYDGNIQKHAIININASSKVKINSNSTFLPFHLIDTISLSVSGNDFIMPSLSIYTKPFEKLYCDINSTLLIKTLNLGYSQYNERTVNSAGDQLLVETLTIFETSNTVYILLIYRITVLKEIFYDTSAYFYGTVATDVSIIATIGTYGYPSLFLSTQSPVELSDIIVTMSVYTSRSLTLLYSESGYDFTYKRLSLRPSEFFDTWYGTKYTGNMISKKVLYNSIEYHSISVQFQYEYPEDIYIYALVILLPIAFGAGLLFGFIHCVCYCRMKKTIEEYEITEGLV